MRETLTDLLDALAIILLAAGLGCMAAGWTAVAMHIDGVITGLVGIGLTVAGLVVFVGSMIASRPPRSSESGVNQ